MKIAEAFVDIRIDKGQAQKEAKSAAESAMSSIRQVFAAGVFIKGIQESISQASDLNETVSKTKVIFGDSGAEIERWSTNSARQFGVSQRAALDAASTFATFGKSAGLAGAGSRSNSSGCRPISPRSTTRAPSRPSRPSGRRCAASPSRSASTGCSSTTPR